MATATKPAKSDFGDAPAGADKLWQQQLIDQLADIDPSDFSHVVYGRDGEKASYLEHHGSEADAVVAAAKLAVAYPELDEVAVVAASELHKFIDKPAPAGDKLFDAEVYTDPALALDKVDEKDVDKIRVDFSGSVMLDRKSVDDVAFMRRLKLGQPLELRVASTVHSKKTGYTTGKEGDLDAIVYTAGLKVDTVYALSPEDL